MDAATKSESSGLHSSLRYKIIAMVGNENVHAATAADTIAGVQPKLVIEPGTGSELAEVLRLANEAGAGGDSAGRRGQNCAGEIRRRVRI